MSEPVAGPTPAGQQRFRLAHLSDPHLSSLDDVHWHELFNKRLLGFLSWSLKRRHVHRPEILRALCADLRRQQPEHIAVTGDLTQLGTASECRQAETWLRQLGPPAAVSLVPGNHDRYARADWQQTLGLWTEYLRGDQGPAPATGTTGKRFPTLQRRGPLALLGLSSAVPTAPFLASGRLGREQLEMLGELLRETGRQGCFRVVMLHHGPVPGTYSRRRSLADDNEFCRLLSRYGAEMVLHGHGHRQVHNTIEHRDMRIPVFGVPSASYASTEPARRAGYNIYDISRVTQGWRLSVTRHSHNPGDAGFSAGEAELFDLPEAAN